MTMATALRCTPFGRPAPARWAMAGVAVLAVLAPVLTGAQIRTDGSLGGAAVTLSGPQVLIPQNLGKLSGANLFHSFATFGIGNGESATFSTSSAGIANVVARVTGGQATRIDGSLRLSAVQGAPALFFINPAGVTVGANGAIDVPGALHLGTADYLVFPDGRFFADAARASTLSAAPVQAFGFLGQARGLLRLENSNALVPYAGQAVSLVAGDVVVDGARITMSGGELRVAAAGSASTEVPLTGDLAAAALTGSVLLRSGARLRSLTTDANPGGALRLGAGQLQLQDGAQILSATLGPGAGGAVDLSAATMVVDGGSSIGSLAAQGSGAAGPLDVRVAGRLSLGNGASISSATTSDGAAGDLRIRAGELSLSGGSRIDSQAVGGNGRAGAVEVAVTGDVDLAEASSLASATYTAGHAGSVRVAARQIRLDGGSSIDSRAGLDSSGQGGNVTVDATGAVLLSGGSRISALTAGTGQAGAVTVNATNVALQGRSYVSTTATPDSSGHAGQVTVRAAGAVDVSDGAFITSDTGGSGNAGAVTVQAGSLNMASAGRISSVAGSGSSGQGGQVNLEVAGALRIGGGSGATASGGSQVSTSTFAEGAGGAVRVRAGSVDIGGSGAGIVSFAHTGSRGNAGSIDVQATGAVTIRQGGIGTSTSGAGAAGQINVRAGSLLLSGPEATINAAALAGSGGQVGSVALQANGVLRLENGAGATIANFASVAPGQAAPVRTRLTLRAAEISLTGAVVSAEALGNTAASDIVLQASQRLLIDRSAVRTAAVDGHGGAITVTGTPAVWLRNAQITTSVSGNSGNGGDISLQAGVLALDHGFIQANTAARGASGGRVQVAVPVLLARGQALAVAGNVPAVFDPSANTGDSVIQAAAPTGVSGVVALSHPALDAASSLLLLRAERLDTAALGRSACAAAGGSSLAAGGRGGLPALASQGTGLRAEAVPANPNVQGCR